MKGLLRVLPVVAMLVAFQPGIEKKGSFDITRKGSFDLTSVTSFPAGDVFGEDVAAREPGGLFDFLELAGGKDPELPVTSG